MVKPVYFWIKLCFSLVLEVLEGCDSVMVLMEDNFDDASGFADMAYCTVSRYYMRFRVRNHIIYWFNPGALEGN